MRIEQIVGGNVRRRRERLGWSQQRLGDAVGEVFGGEPWTRAAVSQYELGDRSFSVASLFALATALGVLPGALLLVPEDVESVDIGGNAPLARDAVQRPGDALDPDSVSERVFELVQGLQDALAAQVVIQSAVATQSDHLSDLHDLAMQARIAQHDYTQGTTKGEQR